MNLLHTLTQAADEEQLRPLPEHAAATQQEYLRQHYALLLAALLNDQPTISQAQNRLLRLLLNALKLGNVRAPLLEQARTLTLKRLFEAVRLIRQAGYAQHLVVDALVLLRLHPQRTTEAVGTVGELSAFLGLDATALAARADDAAGILDPHAAKDRKGAVLAELWPSCLSQPLTAAAVRGGLQGGLWWLDADLAVDGPWQADNAVLVFRNGATLKTVAEQGAVALTACRLADAALAFEGKCSITLKGCTWQGDYDPAAQRTALQTTGQALTVSDCRFATRQARAICVQNAALTLTASHFTQCGHAALDGGAVWHVATAEQDNSRQGGSIDHCHFERCLAARGGAVYTDCLYGVRHCEFSACASVALQDQQAGDVAVYAFAISWGGDPIVSACVFRQTSLVIGDAWRGGYSWALVHSTQFQQGNVYYHDKYPGNTITSDCSFADGHVVERKFA